MIVGIGGWERCGKTMLAAILASNPSELNITGFQEYRIERGYGNLHLYGTPYPWIYLSSAGLVSTIRETNDKNITNALFLIDEADSVYNPRDYTSKEQTRNLKGIGQHAKMGNVFIYTYQLGQPDDVLLGVDKILRSNTRIEFEMRHYNKANDFVVFNLKNRLVPDSPVIPGVIRDVSRFFILWDHKEPVV